MNYAMIGLATDMNGGVLRVRKQLIRRSRDVAALGLHLIDLLRVMANTLYIQPPFPL